MSNQTNIQITEFKLYEQTAFAIWHSINIGKIATHTSATNSLLYYNDEKHVFYLVAFWCILTPCSVGPSKQNCTGGAKRASKTDSLPFSEDLKDIRLKVGYSIATQQRHDKKDEQINKLNFVLKLLLPAKLPDVIHAKLQKNDNDEDKDDIDNKKIGYYFLRANNPTEARTQTGKPKYGI